MEHKTAVNFFILFSKVECSLKRAGYFRGNSTRVEADWDKLAKHLGKEFFLRIKNSNNLKEIINKPPMTQVVKSEALGWRDSGPISNIHELFLALRRVRNNLFHGGKYSGLPVEGSERNENLLTDSIFILTEIIKSEPKVKEYFDYIDV